jgi:hypothetical protein
MPVHCKGKMQNGPNKQFALCPVCGNLDHEKNEGDLCGRVFENYWLQEKAHLALRYMMRATVNLENSNFENIVGLLDDVIDNCETLRRILDDEEFYK